MTENEYSNDQYLAVEIFLELLKGEYHFQEERMKSIDSKAGMLLSIAIFIIPFCFSSIGSTQHYYQAWILIEWYLSTSILLAFSSVLILILSVSSYKYYRLDSLVMTNVFCVFLLFVYDTMSSCP